MSYIRACSPYKYVDGISPGDYVYQNFDNIIVDYGSISDETLVEFICVMCEYYGSQYKDDKAFTDYVMGKISKRLKVKLRKEPLTDEQLLDLILKKM